MKILYPRIAYSEVTALKIRLLPANIWYFRKSRCFVINELTALAVFASDFKWNYRVLFQQISWCNFSSNFSLQTDQAWAQCNSSLYHYVRQKVMTCSLYRTKQVWESSRWMLADFERRRTCFSIVNHFRNSLHILRIQETDDGRQQRGRSDASGFSSTVRSLAPLAVQLYLRLSQPPHFKPVFSKLKINLL